MKNLFVFLGVICLSVATQASAQVKNIKLGNSYLQPKDFSTPQIIHGKRGPSNSVTIQDFNTSNNCHLRDTYQHPEEPKTKLKIEPTPKVIKPKIIPLESH